MSQTTLPKVITSLINSYAVLVMAGRMEMEEVPETRKIGTTEYQIRSNVEIEIAERTIAAIG